MSTKENDGAPDDDTNEPGEAIGTRLAALRFELGFSQSAIVRRLAEIHRADPRIAAIQQTELSKFETKRLNFSTIRVFRALAAAYDVSIDHLDRYTGGVLTLAELVAVRSAGLAAKHPHNTYRRHPRWAQLVVEARALRRHLRAATFEQLADTPVTWATLDTMTAQVLADMADAVQRHIDTDLEGM